MKTKNLCYYIFISLAYGGKNPRNIVKRKKNILMEYLSILSIWLHVSNLGVKKIYTLCSGKISIFSMILNFFFKARVRASYLSANVEILLGL